MTKKIEQIRIFISSPSDVSAERETAQKVIEELDRTLCEPNGLTLFPLTWEKNTYPSVGVDPQDVINNQIGDYDVFVGIMANRFGTPTHRAGSGTEEEFNIAFENSNNKHIMFFFKDAMTQPSSLDLKQVRKVKRFKQQIIKKGVYYKEFSENFENLFRNSFILYLSEKYINKKENGSINKTDTTIQNKLEIDKYFSSRNLTYEKYSNISALAIPNSQFKLKDIYVAQTLVKENRFEDDKKTAKINKLPVKLITKYKKILITDTAGMGKSTIMKYMFIDLIDNRIKDVGIPIYIELNRLKKNHTILQEIKKELKSIYKELDCDLLFEKIQDGGFVFFLDGYDEISIADRTEVTRDIQTFISEAGVQNYYIITSRPEENLSCFGDFQSFKIKPLTKNEAFKILGKYDSSKGKEVSKKLIELLKTGDYDSIDEYLENPLLVSLLYAAFNHKNTIPLKKHLFYRQVYEAFYDAFDFSKGIEPHQKRTGLDIDDFSRVLKCMGYICLEKTGVKFDKETILKVIGRAKDYCANLSFKEIDFLKDVLTAVPLFCKDGNDFKWAHKSLMEYFAARFIAEDEKENQHDILTDILNSEQADKYLNLLDLYYDIDNIGFVKNIEYPLLEDYVKFYKDHYFISSKIKNTLIEERIGFLYAQTVVVDNLQIKEITLECANASKKKKENEFEFDDIAFRELNKMIFERYGINITGATIDMSNSYYIGFCCLPKRSVLHLLARRKKYLFKHVVTWGYKEVDKNFNLEILDCHTGDDNESIYSDLNNRLRKIDMDYDHFYCSTSNYSNYDICYLSIQDCLREIERINKMINKNESRLSLLEDF